jgi:ERCC4-type nuclease
MIIFVDDREPKSIESIMLEVDSEILILRTRLEEGDYKQGNVCIERKEISDFCNSIIDKRIETQIERMKKKYKYNYIIIVGHIKDRNSEIHENCILGKIASLIIKHNVNVLMVDNEWQFLYLMKRIFEKYEEMKKNHPPI